MLAPLLSDYAIIGDTHSCALVTSDGSVDWLCWPRHDSPAVLTRLLDLTHGGCASVHIDGAEPAGRCYRGDSAILETRFRAMRGEAAVIDWMPVAPPAVVTDEGPDGTAQSRLVRLVECRAGCVTGSLRVRLTPGYGADAATVERVADGWRVRAPDLDVLVTASHPIALDGSTLRVPFTLENGERAFVALTAVLDVDVPPITTLDHALENLGRTEEYWSRWCDGIRYDGAYSAAVRRSALTLKLLTYSPTGAIIAAATTSLPEAVPGNRNYDYRYSWVRDASFTVVAFCNLGLNREAAAYLRFLRHADPSQGKDLKLLYAIDGEVPAENTLPQLPGWRGIGPVRIGNAASGQRQHDIHGEYMVALHSYLAATGYVPSADFAKGLPALVRTLAENAIDCRHEPDNGIWELRGEPSHLQHSKALLWVCLDRAVKIATGLGGFEPEEIDRWHAEATNLRAEYERETWNDARGAWMQGYGSDVLDAAVLRTVLFDALDPSDPRLISTLDAIDRELTDGDLVYRYHMDDGLEGEEATFTACAFWRAGALALAGRTATAKALFERLLARANDVGLFAEEIDAATGEQRGNLPQGFTHMCVINHAVRLEEAIARFGLKVPHAAFFNHNRNPG